MTPGGNESPPGVNESPPGVNLLLAGYGFGVFSAEAGWSALLLLRA